MSEKGGNGRGASNRKSSSPTLNSASAEDGPSNNVSTTSSVCSMSSTATITASKTNPSLQQSALLSQQLKRLAAQKLQQPQDLGSSAAGLSQYSAPSPPTKRRRSGSFDKRVVTSGQAQPYENKRVGFIGAGNMARAIAEGWINSGVVPPTKLSAVVRTCTSPNMKLMRSLGVLVSATSYDVIGASDVIIIAVKPYQVLEVMDNLLKVLKTAQVAGSTPKSLRPLIVSVASSVPLAELEKRSEVSWQIGTSPVTGHLPIIRCIPNMSVAVQSGVTAYTRGKYCNEEDLAIFKSLFSLLGHCEEVEEKLMDGFTSLTGSGIAFMEVVLEAMADGGVMTGIPHSLSLRMSAHTMIGAANLVLKKNLHPGQVKNSVASPAGTTIQGLAKIEDSGVRGAVMSAVKAASDRAAELKP